MSATAADAVGDAAGTDAAAADATEQSGDAAEQSTKLSSEEVASQLGDAQQTQGDGSMAGANAADVDSLA